MAQRKKGERQNDLVLIAELYVKNYSVRSIQEKVNAVEGREVTVSFQTIHNDIKAILKEWQKKKEDLISNHVAIELEKSLVREKAIWDEWEKTKSEQTSKQTKKQGDKEGPNKIETKEETEEGVGYYKYMELMRKEADFRCKLLGSFAAININNNVKTDGAVIILPSNGRDNDGD